MSRFRVIYSRGSFAFAITCETREQALARAIAISRQAGVWHVHVEDGGGTRTMLPDIFADLSGGMVPAARAVRRGRERFPT